jgi:hypothetical protein
MAPVNSRSFPQVYVDLGIDPGNLGCIMLDVQPIVVSDVIDAADLYVSEKPGLGFVKGNVSEDVPHVTLLYGLLRPGPELKKHVDAVLEVEPVDGGLESHWDFPEDVVIDKVDFFYSPDSEEHFVTIVALLQVSPGLAEANGRLRLLPHIDTFMEYKPHITLAYVSDSSDWQGYIKTLNEKLAGQSIRAVALNYGN